MKLSNTDNLYVEVASAAAARRVLQMRQNVYMCGGKITGGRKRAVTVSQVTHEELIREASIARHTLTAVATWLQG